MSVSASFPCLSAVEYPRRGSDSRIRSAVRSESNSSRSLCCTSATRKSHVPSEYMRGSIITIQSGNSNELFRENVEEMWSVSERVSRPKILSRVTCSASANPNSDTTMRPPLRVIISGAPASGKGTQCEEIVKKYGLTHISAGDLLRAEVAAGTEFGNRVQSFMDAGSLVPDEVVISIVKNRLAQPDAVEHGWLLDGYPRSASQAVALEKAGIKPQVFIVLEVPEGILVERVVGRRLDPVTGRIYHLTFSPPENDEIASRLTQRSDDTEDKVKARLVTHRNNVDSVLAMYSDIVAVVNGARSKDEVFADIDEIMASLVVGKEKVPQLS